jgi:hypothetical protein
VQPDLQELHEHAETESACQKPSALLRITTVEEECEVLSIKVKL